MKIMRPPNSGNRDASVILRKSVTANANGFVRVYADADEAALTAAGWTVASVHVDLDETVALRKTISPLLAKLERLEARIEEIGRQPVPPPILRKITIAPEPEPVADRAYDHVAALLEKAARAGLGREFDDAASQLRRRCDSAPALAAASAIGNLERSRT